MHVTLLWTGLLWIKGVQSLPKTVQFGIEVHGIITCVGKINFNWDVACAIEAVSVVLDWAMANNNNNGSRHSLSG